MFRQILMTHALRNYPTAYRVHDLGVCETHRVKPHHCFFRDKLEVCLRFSGRETAMDRIGDKEYRTPYPHVYFKRPGVNFFSGADEARNALFFSYERAAAEEMTERKLLPRAPFLPFTLSSGLLELCDRLRKLMERSLEPGVADKIDMVCLLLLSELTHPAEKEADDPILAIASRLRIHYGDDLERLAARHGMSLRTFYRKWKERFPESPARFAMEQKLAEACRLLRETTLPSSEIARRLHLSDDSYFVKVFKRKHGISPGEYRHVSRENADGEIVRASARLRR